VEGVASILISAWLSWASSPVEKPKIKTLNWITEADSDTPEGDEFKVLTLIVVDAYKKSQYQTGDPSRSPTILADLINLEICV